VNIIKFTKTDDEFSITLLGIIPIYTKKRVKVDYTQLIEAITLYLIFGKREGYYSESMNSMFDKYKLNNIKDKILIDAELEFKKVRGKYEYEFEAVRRGINKYVK
jgi:hypothetical protein